MSTGGDEGARSRLEAFDAFADEVRADLSLADERMGELRGQGKVKTATYRQLFTMRETLREIDRRLSDHGL